MVTKQGWQITSQATDQTSLDNAGNTVVGVNIYFTTSGGNDGVVFVPNRLYGKRHLDEIKATIREQATLLDAVGNLSENME